MSKRIDRSRRHGHEDPHAATKAPTSKDGRVSVVTPRNPPRDEDVQQPKRTHVAFRHELSDRHGSYTGTFVTDKESWQVGDTFTTGDGRTLRITAISASERSTNRPAYTDRWNVEAAQPRVS